MFRSSLAVFLAALNIALGIVVVAWLHSPPFGYQHGNGFPDHLPDWVVAVFTGLLAYATYRLVRATIDLRSATDKLWASGEKQIAIAQDNIALARDQFIATHRPKVIVHSVENATFEGSMRREDRCIRARLRSVNVGVGRTKIIQIGATFLAHDAGSLRPGIEIDAHDVEEDWLSSGEWRTFEFDSDINYQLPLVEEMREGRRLTFGSIVCIGYIRYADEKGAVRQTGFCRTYKNQAWERVDNPDYEYAY